MSKKSTLRRLFIVISAGVLLTAVMSGAASAVTADWWKATYGDGAWHTVGAWRYLYGAGQNLGYWQFNGKLRFRYDYGPKVWRHTRDGSNWAILAASGVCTDWVGDGSYHNVATNFYYQYAGDIGSWSRSAAAANNRYRFAYGAGLWALRGYGGSWNTLSASGRPTGYLAENSTLVLGNGYDYRDVGTLGLWVATPAEAIYKAYRYEFGSGIWDLKGYGSVIAELSAAGLSSAFVGDHHPHSLGNGWAYDDMGDELLWAEPANYQISYKYAWKTGVWYLKGIYGEGGYSYFHMGKPGLTALFMGSGTYRSIGNGWWYRDQGRVWGYWSTTGTNAGDRYVYNLYTGQWQLRGPDGTWHVLGEAKKSPMFMGDGDYHYLGDYSLPGYGTPFYYHATGSVGYWSISASTDYPYAYLFSNGTWMLKGASGGWSPLGTSGKTSEFIGSGKWFALGNGWQYQDRRKEDVNSCAVWSPNGTMDNLWYGYYYSDYSGQSLWVVHGYYTDVYPGKLGKKGLSSSFMGDGKSHDLGGGYSYQATLWFAYLSDAAGVRYRYDFATRQWWLAGSDNVLHTLGNAQAADGTGKLNFDADDAEHLVWFFVQYTTGASAAYRGTATGGYWLIAAEGHDVFSYRFSDGQWLHQGAVGGMNPLGPSGRSTDVYMGDGAWHPVNGYLYRYSSKGLWKDGSDNIRYSFNYSDSAGNWMYWPDPPAEDYIIASGGTGALNP